MKDCTISITTTIDGETFEIVRKGKCELSLVSALLYYKEEQAKVAITLQDGVLEIEREGDYTQALRFENEKTCEGKLGIMGTEGDIYTKTHKLGYALTENSLLLSLHYDLIIGNELQYTKIRLFVKSV